MGVGAAASDSKQLDAAMADLRVITGQQPCVTHAKKSIAGFHIRQGMAIGCKVTLRGNRMWEFLDRLLSMALPRVRDFRGIPTTSLTVAATIRSASPSSPSSPRPSTTRSTVPVESDITFVTTAENNTDAKALLDALGFPFKKN